jgi:3-dehydroquinate synthase
MLSLKVDLGERSYPIYIGSGILEDSDLLRPHIHSDQVLVVSNETVAPMYMQSLLDGLAEYTVEVVTLPDGEQYKNLHSLNLIFDALLENNFNRDCTLIALGGGVIGDITGFAAASYQRGVDFIQIPTTLLAQVDSSVGGKTGVNHAAGKNMIGAFHQPNCVGADTRVLNTLPDRELSCGLAEVIKYGLIGDLDFVTWLEQNMRSLRSRDQDTLAKAIEISCSDKAKIVAADEFEKGSRALLNFGHTFGHAIETCAGYGNWLHGEAVAAGMLLATKMSCALGWLGQADVDRVGALLDSAGLPLEPPADMSADQFLELMAVDKKVVDGEIRLVLLKAIGKALITKDYDKQILRKVLTGE